MGHNGAARAGLANLTMTSAVEWAAAGVRVNCVIPGFIATTGLDRYPDDAKPGLRNVVKKAPISRHGTAAEISAAAVFFMSAMSSYTTGTELIVDGGMQFGSWSSRCACHYFCSQPFQPAISKKPLMSAC